MPLNQSLSSDQHNPRTQGEKLMSSCPQKSEALARVDRRETEGDVWLNTSTKTSSLGQQVLRVLGGA